jgi:hypothetical protein
MHMQTCVQAFIRLSKQEFNASLRQREQAAKDKFCKQLGKDKFPA